MDSSSKVLLIHKAVPDSLAARINLVPMGLFPLANYLSRRGIGTEIVHEGLEQLQDPKYNLLEDIAKQPPLLLGFTLSFYQQARSVIQAAKEVKKKCPSTKIVLGGYTASRFAEEILTKYSCLDYVIRGEAEVPLSELAKHLLEGHSDVELKNIPNLLWPEASGEVSEGPERYALDETLLSELSFTDFSLMRHGKEYSRLRISSSDLTNRPVFYFSAGRGCPGQCLYCGGSQHAFNLYNARPKPFLFPHEYVLNQLEQLIRSGIKHWNSCYDPVPDSDYYPELFKKIRARDLTLHHVFDCFGLPSAPFLSEFSQTFGGDSALNLSPDTGSENLRLRLKSFSYSNAELLDAIAAMERVGLKCSVYFSTGFPFETAQDFQNTLNLIKEIRAQYPWVRIEVQPLDLEPGSLFFDCQSEMGIKSQVNDFESLVKCQQSQPRPEYGTEHFTAEQIRKNLDSLQVAASA